MVQGTAGTAEESVRYGWNYARLIAEGPSRTAMVPSPVSVSMRLSNRTVGSWAAPKAGVSREGARQTPGRGILQASRAPAASPYACDHERADGIGEHQHAEARAWDAAAAISASTTFLRGSQFGGPQNAPHCFPAERQIFLSAQFLREMRIVEANILAACQFENRPALSSGESPGHGPSTIAVMHPGHGIGTVAPLEPLHLAFTQLQQTSSFFTFPIILAYFFRCSFSSTRRSPSRSGDRSFRC